MRLKIEVMEVRRDFVMACNNRGPMVGFSYVDEDVIIGCWQEEETWGLGGRVTIVLWF